MSKTSRFLTAIAATFIASPALADDAAMDAESMVEQSSPISVDAITPAVGNFNIAGIGRRSAADFMATMSSAERQSFRLNEPRTNFDQGSSAGLVGLFVPEEFAYRSNARDTGVDNVIPGRYLSNSTRSDYLSETGPATRDKSSLGIRLGF